MQRSRNRVLAALADARRPVLAACGINSIPTAEEKAKAKWADVQAAYQRRADLSRTWSRRRARRRLAGAGDPAPACPRRAARATRITVIADQLTDPAAMARFAEAQSRRLRLIAAAAAGGLSGAPEPAQNFRDPAERSSKAPRTASPSRSATITRRCRPIIRGSAPSPSVIGAKVIYGAKPMVPFEATRRARTSRRRSISATCSKLTAGAARSAGRADGASAHCSSLLAAAGRRRAGAATDFPAFTGRVVDEAKLLPPAQEAELTPSSRRSSGHRAASWSSRPSRACRAIRSRITATGSAAHWGIGQQGANNGVILLVAPNERNGCGSRSATGSSRS